MNIVTMPKVHTDHATASIETVIDGSTTDNHIVDDTDRITNYAIVDTAGAVDDRHRQGVLAALRRAHMPQD